MPTVSESACCTSRIPNMYGGPGNNVAAILSDCYAHPDQYGCADSQQYNGTLPGFGPSTVPGGPLGVQIAPGGVGPAQVTGVIPTTSAGQTFPGPSLYAVAIALAFLYLVMRYVPRGKTFGAIIVLGVILASPQAVGGIQKALNFGGLLGTIPPSTSAGSAATGGQGGVLGSTPIPPSAGSGFPLINQMITNGINWVSSLWNPQSSNYNPVDLGNSTFIAF